MCRCCLQDKNLRALVLTCLCQCFHSYLGRVRATARLSEVNAYLTKHTKPLLQNLRKNNLQQPDQHVSNLTKFPLKDDSLFSLCMRLSGIPSKQEVQFLGIPIKDDTSQESCRAESQSNGTTACFSRKHILDIWRLCVSTADRIHQHSLQKPRTYICGLGSDDYRLGCCRML